MDPKAKFRPADLLPWALTRIPRGPSPLAQNTVQTYALVQEEQNNSMLTKVGSTTTRQGLILYFIAIFMPPERMIGGVVFLACLSLYVCVCPKT